jgi:TolB-like protein
VKYLQSFQNSLYLCLIFFATCALAGCSYSLSGAAVPVHWQAIAVALFEDESNFGQPGMREDLTNLLIAKFQRDNTLRVSDRSTATVELSGRITSVVADQPVAVVSGAEASRMQVVVRVQAVLFDRSQNRQVWKKDFSALGDYAAGGGIVERNSGIRLALENVSNDILLETVSAW